MIASSSARVVAVRRPSTAAAPRAVPQLRASSVRRAAASPDGVGRPIFKLEESRSPDLTMEDIRCGRGGAPAGGGSRRAAI